MQYVIIYSVDIPLVASNNYIRYMCSKRIDNYIPFFIHYFSLYNLDFR